MTAYLFPGQGSQFPGMGKDIYEKYSQVKDLFEQANTVLGFRITDTMFSGSEDDLKQTRVTQPSIFITSVAMSLIAEHFSPDMVAGHSLGEFSALVANKTLSFDDALNLVIKRANAMQKACEMNPSTMAAVMGIDENKVLEICKSIDDVVVPANYNCPGQLVISGSINGIEKACLKLKEAGAKRAMVLPVGGAFHSPLMEPAKKELEEAIKNTYFKTPICPVYQNVNAKPETNPQTIKNNLILQLTAPVLWSQTVQSMYNNGAKKFIECGPGKVLQGLVRKIVKEAEIAGILDN